VTALGVALLRHHPSLGAAVELALAVLVVDNRGVDKEAEEDNTANVQSASCPSKDRTGEGNLTE